LLQFRNLFFRVNISFVQGENSRMVIMAKIPLNELLVIHKDLILLNHWINLTRPISITC